MRSNTEFELKSSELDRISFLAQPKQSEMVWFTRPWMLKWGNQESIRPLSHSALRAIPSPRIKALAQHKKDFSCHQTERGKEEEGRMMKKMLHPSHTLQYEHIIRLATPKPRGRISQEVGSPHSELCEYKCPIWHVKPCVRNISKRLLQLALPKSNHPNFTSDRQNIQTFISCSAKTAKMTPRLEQLSLPKLRENRHFYDLGEPESPIRPVSREARNAIASARVRSLSSPKPLSKDYIHPKEPAWRT